MPIPSARDPREWSGYPLGPVVAGGGVCTPSPQKLRECLSCRVHTPGDTRGWHPGSATATPAPPLPGPRRSHHPRGAPCPQTAHSSLQPRPCHLAGRCGWGDAALRRAARTAGEKVVPGADACGRRPRLVAHCQHVMNLEGRHLTGACLMASVGQLLLLSAVPGERLVCLRLA